MRTKHATLALAGIAIASFALAVCSSSQAPGASTTPPAGPTPPAAPTPPQGRELWGRRIIAVLVFLMAVVAYVVPRIAGDEDFWTGLRPISLQAAILIATFAVFSASVQNNRSFFIGVAGVLFPLIILYVVALPAAAVGESTPEWADLMTGAFSIFLLGLSVFGPGERHIFE